MQENDLNYGEVITLHGFWEACRYYLKKHKNNNLEIKFFSLAKESMVTIEKKDDKWYIINNNEKKELENCYEACTELLKYLSLDKEEEEELLRIFASSIKTVNNNNTEELTETYKVFKKCLRND